MSGVGPKTANTFRVPVPGNYVAGVGRGALGFTTRSDIGPSRPAETPADGADASLQFGQAPAGYVAGQGRGMGELARGQSAGGPPSKDAGERDTGDYSESNYDEFSGYTEKTAATPYEDDDVEADRIYEAIDDHMDSRRKRRREQKMLEMAKINRNERPKISDQFADLKRDLAHVSTDQWEAIPEVGDHTLKLKQQKRNEVFTPLPDFLINSERNQGTSQVVQGGMETPAVMGGTQSVSSGLAEARGTVLSLKLDRMSDSVSGQTMVDPKGYLTDLNSKKVTSAAEVGDIKKARTLLGSVTSTNPNHGPGWIAAARVEEYAGKVVEARKVIRQGCEACPDAEDVWLEAARLHTTDNAKNILANAVHHIPTSVKIWLYAAEIETLELQKKIVLRRALEFIPNSVKLWKTAIELESVVDARIMLARAVECVPHSVEIWLALAKLESYENARKVLNQAREAVPTEPAIWITAAKLEEAHDSGAAVVDRIIAKTMSSLQQYQVIVSREQWLKEAESAEQSGAVLTCAAIVRHTIHLGIDEEDRESAWIDDAEACVNAMPPMLHTARAIYSHAISVYPKQKHLWISFCLMEKEYGSKETLEATLTSSVQECPKAEMLWLMAAKEKWLSGDVPAARGILVEAFDANPDSEQVWLAAVKLEWENSEYNRARILLQKARDRCSTQRVWMKSALLEIELDSVTQALVLLDMAIKKYPDFHKYYLMAAQACYTTTSTAGSTQDPQRARDYYMSGLHACPLVMALWRGLIRLEEQVRGVNKARSIVELARVKVGTKCDELWLEAIQLERRHHGGSSAAASGTGAIVPCKESDMLMAKALQECPASGLLWAEDILTCTKAQQKSKSMDALKRCDNDPLVITAVARIFEKDRKYAKARKWYTRATALNDGKRLGDIYIYYYLFELHQQQLAKAAASSSEAVKDESSEAFDLAKEVLARCVAAEPNKGSVWCEVSKSVEGRKLLRNASDAASTTSGVGAILKKAVDVVVGADPRK